MSTDIPFGAHPSSSGAPPTSVVHASAYFGAPTGSSPTDVNPFHFAGTAAPPPMGPPTHPSQQPGPPSASNFFHPDQPNPNMNIFNPGATVGGGPGVGTQYPQTYTGDSFGPPSAVAPPLHQPSPANNLFSTQQRQSSDNFFKPSAARDQLDSTHQGTLSNQPGSSATPHLEGGQSGYHRHSSAPSLPGATNIFGAPPANLVGQPSHASNDFFSSPPSNQGQYHSLPSSASQEFQSSPPNVPRPLSQEPSSPMRGQPETVAGSFSAPSTSLHPLLPSSHDQQLNLVSSELPQQVFGSTGYTEDSSMPSFRPPSNADTHSTGGAHDYPMTNAHCVDSSVPLLVNQSGVLPSQVHPSLTDDLGITNASHSSQANLRTNASMDIDVSSISAAIEDATTPDDVTSPGQWGQSSSNESSGRERNSSLNLDSSLNKSVSSLLEGNENDFSNYSPIRLLPPAPLGGDISPQTLPSSSANPVVPPASLAPWGEGGGEKSNEGTQFTAEHGHEKKSSDDFKDWEIVDSIPLTSEVSQLPSSVKLLPPSSFTTVSSESIQSAKTSTTADSVSVVGQAFQQLSLDHTLPGVHQPAPRTSTDLSHMSNPIASASATAALSLSAPTTTATTTTGQADQLSRLDTNLTNLETQAQVPQSAVYQPGPLAPTRQQTGYQPGPPAPTAQTAGYQAGPPAPTPQPAGYQMGPPSAIPEQSEHQPGPPAPITQQTGYQPGPPAPQTGYRPSQTESRLSSNLPEPKDISSLITQIPFLPPATSQPASHSSNTSAPLSLHADATSVASVNLVPSSLQGGGPPVSASTAPPTQRDPPHILQGAPPSMTTSQQATPPILQGAPPPMSTSQQVASASLQGGTAPPPQISPPQQHYQPPEQLTLPPAPTLSVGSSVGPASSLRREGTYAQHVEAASSVGVTTGLTSQTGMAASTILSQHQPPTGYSLNGTQPTTHPTIHSATGLAQPPPPSAATAPVISTNQQFNPVPTAFAPVQQSVGVSNPPPVSLPPPPSTTVPAQPLRQSDAGHAASSASQHLPTTGGPPPSQALPSSYQPHPPLSDASHRPHPQVTTGVTESTSSSQVAQHTPPQYREERREGREVPHQPRPEDHGYGYHEQHPSDRERGGRYYGDPGRERAPSAFSERDPSEHYRHGYHPRPESHPRHDYSHYPEYPMDPGYGYGSGYGYDPRYHRGAYPPLYGPPGGRSAFQDEFGMPVHPSYYDQYDPHRYHHPRFGGHYPPPPRSSYYGSEYEYDYQYEHDPRQSEGAYDSHNYPQPSYGEQEEEFNASAIGAQTSHFEMSQFVESPNTRLPGRPHPQNNSTAYLDPQHQLQEAYHHQYPSEHDYHQGYEQVPNEPWYYPPDGHYPEGDGSYIAGPHYNEQRGDYQLEPVPTEPPVESTPPPPPRETPELFAHPHVRATFGFGGQLVTVIPSYVSSPTVEITFIKDVVNDVETTALLEAVDSSPGPFVPGDTPKGHVVRFASKEAQRCREKMSQVEADQEAYKRLEDEALMWDFLVLLCQQNGVVVTSDISDLLMKDTSTSVVKSTPQQSVGVTQGESLDAVRQLLFAGRKRDAVDTACSKGLWGHALMLASRMDEQTRTYVVNRFTASLVNTDPLNTFYTLLLGRTPSAVKPEGLPRAGDWKPHLSMILANRMTKLENASIVSLGDSLLSQKRLHAAHLCYHLASVPFGVYGNVDSKYSLLGTDHSHLSTGSYPQPTDLHMMEVLEYAMSLSKHDFLMPNFQLFKFLYVLKLLELGFVSKALKYCEQISCSAVAKNPHCFSPVFLYLLVETSVRLHHLCSPFDIIENEFPSWLHQLQQLVADALSTDYAPSLLSPSPAFSSVSQGYGGQISSQPVIGLQQTTAVTTGGYLDVPGTAGGSSRVESGASSKDSSVINMKIDSAAAHLMMRGPPLPPSSNDTAPPSHETVQSGADHQQHSLAGPAQSYETSQYPTGYDPSGTQQQVGGSEAHSTQAQFTMGSSDGTGYGQYGATTAEASLASSNQHEQNSGHWQAQVVPDQQFQGAAAGGQYGQMMMSQVPPGSQLSEGTDGAGAAGGGGEGGEVTHMGYGNYYGQPGTQPPQEQYPTPAQPTSSEAPPPQPGYPPQTGYDYSQWPPQTDLTPQPFGGQESSEDWRQHQQGSNSRKEAESVPSGDSHVTKKKSEEEKEGKGKVESKKGEKNGKGNQQRPVKSGSGWGFGFIKYILPKKKNQAHLPDDKNPTIVWDEEKKQWVDLTADVQEQSGPPPPPTDAQLTQTKPTMSAPPSSGGGHGHPPSAQPGPLPPASLAGGPSQSAGGVATDFTDQGPSKGTYSMKKNRRDLKSKYVDIFNQGSTKSGSSGPPPPGPQAMLPAPPQPFSGTFFVPQQPPVEVTDDGRGVEGSETPVAPPTEGGSAPPPSASTTDNGRQTSGTPGVSLAPAGLTSQEQTLSSHPPAQSGDSREQYQSRAGLTTAAPPASHSYQDHQPPHRESAQRDGDVSGGPHPVSQFPQFFNPGAFAPVNTFPQGLPGAGANATEPQDDALSTVSLISEASHEVSQYMNKQAPSTSSAGYSRLKHRIRGVKPYPSAPGGGAQQQRPHPGHASRPGGHLSGPPPAGSAVNTFQPRQSWQ